MLLLPKMLALFKIPISTRTRTILVGIFVLVLVPLGFYFYFSKPSATDTFGNLDGKLYLTLSPVGENRTRLYKYNLSTKLLERIAPLNIFAMTASLSPNKKETALSMYPQKGTATTTLQIHIRVRQTGEVRQLTHSSTALKRMPDWSPDGTKIAFMAWPSDKKLSSSAWSVYVTDLSGNETFIAEGRYPKWSPDGTKLIILKNDGLYLYNLASTIVAGKKLWDERVHFSMTLALNANRDILAWTNADSEELLIFSIDFANERITLKNRIKAFGFWSVFSPNGSHLIVEEGTNAANLQPHLTAYNLITGEKKKILDLRTFDEHKMFLTDWRLF